MQPAALLKGAGTSGRGEGISRVRAVVRKYSIWPLKQLAGGTWHDDGVLSAIFMIVRLT